MTMRTGNFSGLQAPGLRKVFFEEWEQVPEEYSRYFNMLSTTKPYEDDRLVTGLGQWAQKPEGTATQFDEAAQGGTVRYTPVPWGSGFRITHEQKVDDMYNVFGNKMAKELAAAGRATIETEAAKIFNNATSATVAGFDGLALATASHTGARVGLQSNYVTADLGVASLKAAITKFGTWKTETGRPFMANPKILVINPADLWTAQELLHSTYIPQVAGGFSGSTSVNINTMNALAGSGLTVVVSHYLTDADSWVLLGDKHDLNFFWREKPVFQAWDDPSTGDALYRGYMRFTYGFGDWRGCYYSAGV